MANSLSPDDTATVDRLVATFIRIGAERMRDLPLYNPGLEVEAIGFRRYQDWLAGILVTPWFMNFVLLPREPARLASHTVGARHAVSLPRGEQSLIIGEIEEFGRYAAASLHSPMGQFPDQGAARMAAWAAVETYFHPHGEPPAAPCSFGWPEHAR